MNILDLDYDSLNLILNYLNHQDSFNFALTNKELYQILKEQTNQKINLPRIERDGKLVTSENLIQINTNCKKIYNKDKGFLIIFSDEFMKDIDEFYEEENTNKCRRNKVINIVKEIDIISLDDKGNLYYQLYEVEAFILLKTNVKNFVCFNNYCDGEESLYILDNYGYIYEGNSYSYLDYDRLVEKLQNPILNGKKFKDCKMKLLQQNLFIIDKINRKIYFYDFDEFVEFDDDNYLEWLKTQFKRKKIDKCLYEFGMIKNDDKIINYLDKFKFEENSRTFMFIYDNKFHLNNNYDFLTFDDDYIDFTYIVRYINNESKNLIFGYDSENVYLFEIGKPEKRIIYSIKNVEKLLISKYKIDKFKFEFFVYETQQRIRKQDLKFNS